MAILHQSPAHKPPPDGPLHVLIDSTGLLGLWSGTMAEGDAWCQLPPLLAQAASGAGCR
ncbi:hypothetical protein BQ8482_290063 [Mesorhizobium delmotii]|uniref:Uncharacterized protein n=1 Tax=Mesorhizobium delmotii TaxID=1631247 RepID=A0A2P9AMV9_9HYPH|nr:hypothetical protein BQ8482_290063 [Mesorhizobium delmotii]